MNNVGITNYHSIQFYTKNLLNLVEWHKDKLGFYEVAKSTPEWEKVNGMRSVVLMSSKDLTWIFTEPIQECSSAGKYLSVHPDGVSYLNFRVKKIDETIKFLKKKKAPLLYEVSKYDSVTNGFWKEAAIATAMGDVGIRFIESHLYTQYAPGFQWTKNNLDIKYNSFFLEIDHIVFNSRSMYSIIEFLRNYLEMEEYWETKFHTIQDEKMLTSGSGLESIVMWEKKSGIKITTNQPLYPCFKNSQVQIYIDDNCGEGVQHIALSTKNIISTVEKIKLKGVYFLKPPYKYFKLLQERMKKNNIKKINEPLEKIRNNNILFDGKNNKYLLQIFMKEQSIQFMDKQYGPFFYEIIQREGEESFGEGNFKALFDSIEEEQQIDSNEIEMRFMDDLL